MVADTEGVAGQSVPDIFDAAKVGYDDIVQKDRFGVLHCSVGKHTQAPHIFVVLGLPSKARTHLCARPEKTQRTSINKHGQEIANPSLDPSSGDGRPVLLYPGSAPATHLPAPHPVAAADGQPGIPSDPAAGVKSDDVASVVVGRVGGKPCIARRKGSQAVTHSPSRSADLRPEAGTMRTVYRLGAPARRSAGKKLNHVVRLNLFWPQSARSSFPRVKFLQEPMRGLAKCFKALMCVVAHAAITNTWGIPYDGKYPAQRAKSTA